MRFDPSGDVPFQLGQILNGGVEFDEHMRGTFVEVTLVEGEQELHHNLGYTPVGFILIMKKSSGDVWATRQRDWNSESLWLESDAESLEVRLFVL